MAESAVRNGYSAIALDAFGDRDLRALTESHSLHRDFNSVYSTKALFQASRSLTFDMVAYTSNLENHPKILRQFEAKHQIIGNSPQVTISVRNWPTLFPKLKQAGFSVPDTIFPDDSREINTRRQWLVKPLLSGGGHGIKFAIPGTQYLSRKTKVFRDKYCVPGFMLQEYIPGKSCSASFVANGKECVVLGITEQLIGLRQFGSHGFRYCGNILPLPELCSPVAGNKTLEQVNNLASFLTKAYGLIGVNGVDFILNGDRVYLIEVNPRYSASMELIERAYNFPIFHLHTQAVLNGILPKFNFKGLLKNRRFFGKAIVFAEGDATASDTRNWAAKGIRDIPECDKKIPRGGPICTLLTGRPTYNEILADLTGRAKELKEEIYGKTDRDLDNRTFDQAGYRSFDWKGTARLSGSH